MALARFQRTITDTTGNVRNGVAITVRDESNGGIAATFADKAGTTPKDNIVTDENGFFHFYVAPGRYRIQATGIDWRDEDLVTVEGLQDAVDQAETARDAAQLTAGVYGNTTDGLAATSDGDYFSTPSGDSNVFLILYRNDAGVATDIETYPSVTGVQATDLTNNPVDSSTGTAQALSAALDSRVIYVNTIADLQALPTGELVDGQSVTAGEYHSGKGVGGGHLKWDASRSKSNHNGGTVFSPTVPWDGTESGLADYLNGVGETDSGGTGCFVRNTESLSAYEVGAHQDFTDNSAPLQACVDITGTENLELVTPNEELSYATELVIDGGKRRMRFQGVLRYTGTSVAVSIDNLSEGSVIENLEVRREFTLTSNVASSVLLYTGIQLKAVRNCIFKNLRATGFASGLKMGYGFTSVYNKFYNINLTNNLVSLDIKGKRDTYYVNENVFFGGRIVINHSPGASNYDGTRYLKIHSVDTDDTSLFGGWASSNKFYSLTMESLAVERKLDIRTTDTKIIHGYFEGNNSYSYDMEIAGSGNYIEGKDLDDQRIQDEGYGVKNSYKSENYQNISGNIGSSTITITSDTNVSDKTNILVDTSAGGVVVTLPDATDAVRGFAREYHVQKISTDNNLMRVISSGLGGRTWRYEAPNSRATFVSDGTDFRVMQGNTGSTYRALAVNTVPSDGRVQMFVTEAYFVDAAPSSDPTKGHRVDFATSDLNGLHAICYPRRANELRVLFFNESGVDINLGTVDCWFYYS